MPTPRLASLIAAVTVAGLAAAGCADQSAALRFDDRTLSRPDFEDQLDFVYETDAVREELFPGVGADQFLAPSGAPDAYSQAYAGAMLTNQVQVMAVQQIVDDEGIEIDDDVRDSIAVDYGYDDASEVPDEISSLIDAVAGGRALEDELGGAEASAVLGEAIGSADIEVSSHYGEWDAQQLTVVPPDGPREAPGAESETVPGAPAPG